MSLLRDMGLISFMADAENEAKKRIEPETEAIANKENSIRVDGIPSRHIAFLAHLLKPQDISFYDKQLAAFSPEQCQKLVSRGRKLISPFIINTQQIYSPLGRSVSMDLIAVFDSPEEMMKAYGNKDSHYVEKSIRKAVLLAKNNGAEVIGFGAYTSIFTNNCLSVLEDDVCLTSGNSLTTASAIEAIKLGMLRLKLSQKIIGIVGPLGNIGRMVTYLLSKEADKIILIGRPGSDSRLKSFVSKVYQYLALELLDKDIEEKKGDVHPLTHFIAQHSKSILSGNWQDVLPTLMATNFIEISTDMRALLNCNVIVGASNAAHPIISSSFVASGIPVLISDIAQPQDVNINDVLAYRPNASIIQGGLISLPSNQHIEFPNEQLGYGQIYGCMAETIILGLSDVKGSGSYGDLTISNLKLISSLAKQHGFKVSENTGSSRINDGCYQPPFS